MANNHGHDHAAPRNYNQAFALGVALNVVFVAVEAAFGIMAGSLALLADAGHNLSDVLGLLLAWGASYLAQSSMTSRRTFGLKKATILAALMNAIILLVAIGGILWEAVRRFNNPAPVSGTTVILVATVGIIINTATMLLFVADRHRDLNIRGAFLHMAADAAVSVGVVVAGIVILYTGALWVDPLVSIIIAAVILVGTWSLLRDSFTMAMDAVPPGIDAHAIHQALLDLPGVEQVHDLHIWGLSTTETALTAHLVRPYRDDDENVIRQASEMLRHDHGIGHATLQIERGEERCPTGAQC